MLRKILALVLFMIIISFISGCNLIANLNNSSSSSSSSVSSGSSSSLYSSSSVSSSSSSSSNSITNYTVAFDSQGATTAASPAVITVTNPAKTVTTLPLPPIKTGFNFAGWYIATNGGGTQFTTNTIVASNITVYAFWNIIFNYTGAVQTWTIPSGVTKVRITVAGAAGSDGSTNDIITPVIAGKGGIMTADFSVTSGQVLNLYVGGLGVNSTSGGFNGGGPAIQSASYAGGGASDVRIGGTALNNRVIVSGGGGGYGGNGGIGGDGAGVLNANGGNGLTTTNIALESGAITTGGSGGTESGGGTAGSGNWGTGTAGTLGQGGTGYQYGGSGGGGYYGGGGGGSDTEGAHASGGGGSSYLDPSGTYISGTNGVNTGNGYIIISY